MYRWSVTKSNHSTTLQRTLSGSNEDNPIVMHSLSSRKKVRTLPKHEIGKGQCSDPFTTKSVRDKTTSK